MFNPFNPVENSMSHDRYCDLMDDEFAVLTDDEVAQGWHFCPEFDYLLGCTRERGKCEYCGHQPAPAPRGDHG